MDDTSRLTSVLCPGSEGGTYSVGDGELREQTSAGVNRAVGGRGTTRNDQSQCSKLCCQGELIPRNKCLLEHPLFTRTSRLDGYIYTISGDSRWLCVSSQARNKHGR